MIADINSDATRRGVFDIMCEIKIMYIKLTRFDNTPVWLNAAFVVTVEPRRQAGGSIVVPIGDGLDYEVRESPEQVLSMLEGAPVAAVVPVPPPKSLTKTPVDVSAEPMTMTTADVLAASDIERKKNRPPMRPLAPVTPAVAVASAGSSSPAEAQVAKPQESVSASAGEVPPKAESAPESESVPVAETIPAQADDAVTDVFANSVVKTRKPEFTPPVAEEEAAIPKKTVKRGRKPRAKKVEEAVPTAEQIERLRKMAPGSVKKLANTITSQLKLADPDSIIDDLARQGVLILDHDHVIWN